MKHKLLLVFLFVTTYGYAHDLCRAKAEKVLDGDTIKAVCDHKLVSVRLGGIDAPEKKQPYGMAAKAHLQALVSQQVLLIKVVDKDRYGRLIGNLFIGKRYLNIVMIQDGYAWVYTAYKKSADPIYLPRMDHAQFVAQRAKLGLWADKSPQPPWLFRQHVRSTHRKKSH